MTVSWTSVVASARNELATRGLATVYAERLEFEIAEVEKQGAESSWIDRVVANKKFKSNPNNLIIPWLLGMVDADPLQDRKTPIVNSVKAAKIAAFKTEHGYIPHDLIKDPDNPDIDIDCLPEARDPLKEYAISQYGQDHNDGYGSVCSVGTWQTYKFKSALVDAAIALDCQLLGVSSAQIVDKRKLRGIYEKTVTATLPDDVDELKEGGRATCKHKETIKENGKTIEKECKEVHDATHCPKCGSTDTDAPTKGKIIAEYPILQQLYNDFDKQHETDPKVPCLIDAAVNLVGRVRNMGMHAGAIIITNQPLYGNIPLAKSSKGGYWISMWTEGRNTQLSKFGYVKWDLLGLRTLEYIFNCGTLINENRGITFGPNMEGLVEYNNYKLRHAGYYIDPKGKKHFISLDDLGALKLANSQKTDGVFQFDTELAKSILSNGVRSFEDLMLFNAMGHPGPMQSIPDAVKNRDDSKEHWKRRLADIHPILLEVLLDTYGVLVYQEQLASLWQRLGGFTAPEAQDARKAVAKKHTHKLYGLEQKWLDGASKHITRDQAAQLWEKQVTFGRYAFNKSHAVSYCLVAFKCLWLKAHFAPEWWAAVMSDCHPDKLARYMGVARSEEWSPTQITDCGIVKDTDSKLRFGAVNIDHITTDFTVSGNTINQGLIGIKGIGESAAAVFQGRGEYKSIDEFVLSAPGRQSKKVLERFIKLGAFKHLEGHENAQALWRYYQFKYCKSGKVESGKTIAEYRNELKKRTNEMNGWTAKTIKDERDRQMAQYKREYPKKSAMPKRIANWLPKPVVTLQSISALYPDDFAVVEKLEFQREFLGYWIDSPLDIYECDGNCTIAEAKELAKREQCEVKLEGIIVDMQFATTKKNTPFLRVFITDGLQQALVFVWSSEIDAVTRDKALKEGTGVCMYVNYDDKRGTFSLARREIIHRLVQKSSSKQHATKR